MKNYSKKIKVVAFLLCCQSSLLYSAPLPPLGCSVAKTCKAFNVTSPQQYQVIQRDASDKGKVSFFGSINASHPNIRIALTNNSGSIVAEKTITVSNGTTQFNDSLTAPAGGPYTAWMQELDVSKTSALAEAKVSDVGIGEVFLVAGQSNSAFYGETPQGNSSLTSRGMLNNSPLKQDSLIWSQKIDSGPRGSAWPTFVNSMKNYFKVPVAVVVVGCGGTKIRQWLPSDDPLSIATDPACWPETALGGLYSRLVRASKALVTYRALLWHQGEADTAATTPTSIYKDSLLKIMARLNSDTGVTQKWFVANTSFVPDDREVCNLKNSPLINAGKMLNVRKAQQSLWDNKTIFPGPDTDGLIGPDFRYSFVPDGSNPGACIHFSSNGLKIHGLLWFKAVNESKIIPKSQAPLAMAKQQVYKYSNGNDFIYQLTSGPLENYHYDGSAFKTFKELPSGGKTFHECLIEKSSKHFVAQDQNQQCLGYKLESVLGHGPGIYDSVGAKYLYKFCKNSACLTTTSYDEGLKGGYRLMAILGFVPND